MKTHGDIKSSSGGRAGTLHRENQLGVSSPTHGDIKSSSGGRAGTLHRENPLGVSSLPTGS